MADNRLEVKYMKGINTIVISKNEDDRFFLSNDRSFVITVPYFAYYD